MCLAMEIEVPSAGDSSGRGLNDAAALGPRPSRLPRDFFVPLSQREKATRGPGGDEIAMPAASGTSIVENGTKRRRRQVKKHTVDDASVEKGNDGHGKLSGKSGKNLLGSELAPGKGSPSGAREKVANRRRGRPRKILPDDNDDTLGRMSPEKEQRSDVNESGEPPKTFKEDQDDIDDGAKLSASMKNSVTSSERCHHDGHAGPVSATEEEVEPDSLTNPNVREPSQRTVGQMKRLNENLSSDPDDSRLSQSTPAQDFFMPASRRRKKGDSPGEKKLKNNEAGAVKRKSQANGQAAKNRLELAAASTKLLSNIIKDENPGSSLRLSKGAATVPSGNGVKYGEQTLRQEAILAAQEIARLNAGKATHPFFARKKTSSLKSSVPWDENSAVPLEEVYPGPPIHVTQLPVAESVDLNWTGWTLGAALVNEGFQTGLSGRFMKQLQFPSLAERQGSDWRSTCTTSANVAESAAASIDSVASDCLQSTAFSLEALQDFVQNMKISRSGTQPFGDRGVSTPLSFESLKNRFSWYVARHETQRSTDNASALDREAASSSRNLLWTDLYQPKSSNEVCGNAAAVEFLSTWLSNWVHKINGTVTKVGEVTNGLEANGSVDYDSDKGWFVDDDDFQSDLEDDSGLHTTLLITGPEGCGKSAAIYACAGEQGFTVIEVNASDCRNGALIKYKFGEAMESYGLGKAAQVNAESAMAASMKVARVCNNGSPEPSKEKAAKTINADRGKRKANKSPSKGPQLVSEPNQDESVVDSHSRRKTVILFEDVDKHFEEDKGFLNALVQLSKATKRPIILTSNRAEPGLPAILEKCKVQFGYPTSEELVLHACLVCRAEDTLVTPWFVEHLVDSCQFDIRKIMMALQFWGQGNAFARQPSGIGKSPDGMVRLISDFAHDRQQIYPSRDRLSLRCRRSLSLAGSSELSIGNHEKDYSEVLGTDARWLFELDVHHLILPKLISGSLECPLSLFIAEKLSKAVNELEDHEAQVAACEIEKRSRILQAKLEAADSIRKDEQRLKNGRRRSSEWEPKIATDWIMSSPNPSDDAKGEEHRSGNNWVCSPMSSLRKAKTMARSPLKSIALKSRRALVLSDSDDEQMQLAKQFEASRHSLSKLETTASSAQMLTDQSQVSIAVSGHLEDLDVTLNPICRSSVTGKKKRLQKKSSNGLLSGNRTAEDSECISFQANAAALEQQVAKCEPAAEILSNTSSLIVDTDQNDGLAGPSEPLNLCRVNPESKEGLALVSGVQIEDQRTDSAVSDTDGKFVDKPANSTYSVQLPGGRGCSIAGDSTPSSALLPPLSFEEEIGDFGMVDRVDNGEVRLAQSSASAIEKSQREMYSATCTDSAEQIAATTDLFNVDSTIDIHCQQMDFTERSPSDVYNPVKDTWTNLRDSRQALKSMADQLHHDGDYSSQIFDLFDVISAADVISSVETEEYKAARLQFDGKMFKAFEGNIGHCSDWDGCREIASQLVRSGLRHSLASLPSVSHVDHQIPLLASILEGAKDAAAVGKCMTKSSCLSRKVDGAIANNCSIVPSTRQADRQIQLEEALKIAVAPKVRVSRLVLVEYFAFLSLICQAEETRRTRGFSAEGRRPRRFEHYLTSKLKSFSEVDINQFRMVFNYGKP